MSHKWNIDEHVKKRGSGQNEDSLFYAPLSKIHWFGDVIIISDKMQKLGFSYTFGAFEQGGIFIVP